MPEKKIPLIEVVGPQRNQLTGIYKPAHFYLEIDNWNDYSYYTSYHLHAGMRYSTEGRITLIGHLRILKLGQQTGSAEQLKIGTLDGLGENYCSMPSSLDYYERLSILPADIRDYLIKALRDLIIYPEIREEFKNEEGFKASLMRDMNLNDQIFELAPILLSRNYSKLQDINVAFSFHTPEMDHPLEVQFESPGYGVRRKALPDRIAVLIGRNGSGKSTLLNRIARIAYASTEDRRDETLKSIGILQPDGLGFTRIIALSYSAFDAFNTPGVYKEEKLTIIEEIKNGIGRYVSCGIRDIVAELEETVPNLTTNEKGRLNDEDILSDKNKTTKLKSNTDLAREFSRNLTIIYEQEKEDLFELIMEDLGQEASMFELLPEDILQQKRKDQEALFTSLSTGHKFVIHALSCLMAFAAPKALILFDEPETHLHPPMLAVLMSAIRRILKKSDAFMILATHSPVILQETLQQHVSVVRREGKSLSISKPDIQTYGENIGLLTQLAFGLNAEFSDYHNILNRVLRSMENLFDDNQRDEKLEAIEQLFGIGLSFQARAYIISKLYQDQ